MLASTALGSERQSHLSKSMPLTDDVTVPQLK